ncbi:DUF7344 domain-containing protein [Haladaptatus sp. NG-WS-4]
MTRHTSTGTSNGQAPSLSLDACFEIVADQWRRHLLCYFASATSRTATIDELVSKLIQKNSTTATTNERMVRGRLLHTDLPKLAAFGVIDYDQRDETVRYYGCTELEAVVTVAARMEQSP